MRLEVIIVPGIVSAQRKASLTGEDKRFAVSDVEFSRIQDYVSRVRDIPVTVEHAIDHAGTIGTVVRVWREGDVGLAELDLPPPKADGLGFVYRLIRLNIFPYDVSLHHEVATGTVLEISLCAKGARDGSAITRIDGVPYIQAGLKSGYKKHSHVAASSMSTVPPSSSSSTSAPAPPPAQGSPVDSAAPAAGDQTVPPSLMDIPVSGLESIITKAGPHLSDEEKAVLYTTIRARRAEEKRIEDAAIAQREAVAKDNSAALLALIGLLKKVQGSDFDAASIEEAISKRPLEEVLGSFKSQIVAASALVESAEARSARLLSGAKESTPRAAPSVTRTVIPQANPDTSDRARLLASLRESKDAPSETVAGSSINKQKEEQQPSLPPAVAYFLNFKKEGLPMKRLADLEREESEALRARHR